MEKEKPYQPTKREIKKAEGMMTDEQREMSTYRMHDLKSSIGSSAYYIGEKACHIDNSNTEALKKINQKLDEIVEIIKANS